MSFRSMLGVVCNLQMLLTARDRYTPRICCLVLYVNERVNRFGDGRMMCNNVYK